MVVCAGCAGVVRVLASTGSITFLICDTFLIWVLTGSVELGSSSSWSAAHGTSVAPKRHSSRCLQPTHPTPMHDHDAATLIVMCVGSGGGQVPLERREVVPQDGHLTWGRRCEERCEGRV